MIDLRFMGCHPGRRRPAAGRLVLAALVAASLAGSAQAQEAQAAPAPGTGPSGLPIPRFVSLKSDRVNLRQGPGNDYPIAWVFKRAGLPMEVVKEFESWRQVRDAEGTTGWVWASTLSGRRTALILPWEMRGESAKPALAILRDDDNASASAVAQVEAGVLANIISCDGKWCRVSINNVRGYIEQTKLWGAYQGEVIK